MLNSPFKPLFFLLAWLLPWVAWGDAPPPAYDRIALHAQAWRDVPDNRVAATLAVELEDDDPAELARRINYGMRQALQIAHRYAESAIESETRSTASAQRLQDALEAVREVAPGIKIYSGNYAIWRVERGLNVPSLGGAPAEARPPSWRGAQSLHLETGVENLQTLSALLGQLQETLTMKTTRFFVSDALRDQATEILIDEALDRFKERAAGVEENLGARGYRLMELSIRTPDGGGYMPSRVMSVRDAPGAETAPAFAPGSSRLQVSISGTIELQR